MQPALDQILAGIASLEPMPCVALRVLELSSNEEVMPSELVAVIQADAALTAKVLKLCNSAFYGFRREIGSLQEAGNMLGVSALVGLVLTSCTGRYFRNYGRGVEQNGHRQWEHAVGNALAVHLLAELQGGVDKNRAYTAGLLQNIGQLVMQRFLESDAEQLSAAVEEGADLLSAEVSVFGIHHAEVGARLCERWSFPEVLVDTIRHHHTPDEASADPLLASLVHIGQDLAASVGANQNPGGLRYELSDSALARAGIPLPELEAFPEQLEAQLARAAALVDAD